MKINRTVLLLALLLNVGACTLQKSETSSSDSKIDNTSSVSSVQSSQSDTSQNQTSVDSTVQESTPSSESISSGEISSSDPSSDSSSASSVDSSSSSDSSASSSVSSSSSGSSSSSSGSNGGMDTTKWFNSTIAPNFPSDFYEPVRGKVGEDLKQALHELIDDHDTFGYSSTTDFFKKIDVNPNNSNQLMLFYTGATNLSTSYNKEHVWAKSHGDFGTTSPAGSDLHNLHPCNSNLNSTRGNMNFAEGGDLLSGYHGNNHRDTSSQTFEPSDEFKGDTARTIFYMAVRYEGDKGTNKGEPDLELNSPSSSRYRDFSSGAKGEHGNFDDLYKWATSGQDPVDSYEVNRNNIIYKDYQHNRNPFIDHPEFIEMIYDKEYSGPGALNDNNPYEKVVKTDEELIDEFIAAVEAIDKVTLDSLPLIEKAEALYADLKSELKSQVADYYKNLVAAREEYQALFDKEAVRLTIEAIDAIGEVTLKSREAIEYAEKLYHSLTNEQKALITNYGVLLEARKRFNELKGNSEVLLDESFSKAKNVPTSYSSVTIKLSDFEIFFSSCGNFSSEFRFGGSKAATSVPEGINDALDNLSLHYMTIQHDFTKIDSIKLNTGEKYSETNKVFFLLSDEDDSYVILQEFDEINSATLNCTMDNAKINSGKLTIVVTGAKPRLVLERLTIEGIL